MPALMEKFLQDRLSIAGEVAKLSQEVQAFLLDVKTERQKKRKNRQLLCANLSKKFNKKALRFLTATQKQRLAQAEKQKEDLRQFQEQRLAEAKRLDNNLRQQRLDRAKQLKDDLSQFRNNV